MNAEIEAKWNSIGGENSILGTFSGNCGTCPDGVGAYAEFAAGSIHWHPETGAHFTRLAIRSTWAEQGWERSRFGYPISDPFSPTSHEWAVGWAGVGREKPAEIVAFQRGAILMYSNGRIECRDDAEDTATSILLPLVEAGYANPKLRGEVLAPPNVLPLVAGCADIQLARIRRMGHRGRFPRPHEWENLLPMLEPGEELLWIVAKYRGAYECYLGYKVNQNGVASRLDVEHRRDRFRNLLSQFAWRSFPESQVEELTAAETCAVLEQALSLSGQHATVVTGLPSPKTLEDDRQFAARDENIDLHVSLNDVLEPFFEDDPFCIVATLGRAAESDVRDRLDLLFSARNAIAPKIKSQGTLSVNDQTGRQETITSMDTEGVSQQERRFALFSFMQSVLGASAHTLKDGEIGRTQGGGDGRALTNGADRPALPDSGGSWIDKLRAPYRFSIDAAPSYQRSTSRGRSDTTTTSRQKGKSVTLTALNAELELKDREFEGSIKLLRTGTATGAFHGAMCIYAQDRELSQRIGRSIAAKLAGAKSHLCPFTVIPYHGPGSCSHLTHNVGMHELFRGLALLNSHFAAQMFLTPEAEVPGLRLKRNVFYGRPAQSTGTPGGEGVRVRLGEVAFFGSNVKWAGDYRHKSGGGEQTSFTISGQDLLSHLLITGTTGSGKTVRAVDILNELNPDEFQIIVIESAKKTFRGKFGRKNRNVRVFTLGESRENPLRINPLFFDPGTSLKHHISILADALSDLLPVEALIPEKLREAVQQAYIVAGWNIEQATFDGDHVQYPGVLNLYEEVVKIASDLEYAAELKQNYFGALTGRAKLFIDDLYQDIFAWAGNKSIDELFGEDDVIIEMDALPPSEINMPGFILSLLLQRIRARRTASRRGRKQIVVIEEAHNLLHRRHEAEKSAREAGGGKNLIQQIVRLLQEGRELGIGVVVIDQSPASLADAVLKNTNIKLVHRIIDSDEARLVGSCLGLRDEDWRDLHELETGECVAQTQRAGKPIKLSPGSDPERRPEPVSRPKVPVSVPPDYARAFRILNAVQGQPATPHEVASKAEELSRACLNDWELVRYVVQKFLFVHRKDPQRELPCSKEELQTVLMDLSRGTNVLATRRERFARQIIDLLNGADISPSDHDGQRRELWWTGPLTRLSELLDGSEGWEDVEARHRFFRNLEQWHFLRRDNVALPSIRVRIRSDANASARRQASLKRALVHLAVNSFAHDKPTSPNRARKKTVKTKERKL